MAIRPAHNTNSSLCCNGRRLARGGPVGRNRECRRSRDCGKDPEAVARGLVRLSIEFHTRWRGLRASLRELVFSDAQVRRFYRAQRRRQLDMMRELRASSGAPARSREDDAIHLFTTERAYDAFAQGELRDLGLDPKILIERMVQTVLPLLVQP
jgi:hypothetical protein